jgi:hypothetical protein
VQSEREKERERERERENMRDDTPLLIEREQK